MNRSEGLHHDENQIGEPGIQQAAEVESQRPELLTAAGAKSALEKQGEALRAEEKEQGPRASKVPSGWKKWAGIAILSGASLVQMGCGQAEKSPDLDNRPRAEKLEDKEGQDKNKEFLGDILESISGGEMTIKEDGNAVVYMGGKYYELNQNDLAKMAGKAGNYSERLEREKKGGMKAFVETTRRAMKLDIVGDISRGREIPQNELSENMRNFLESVKDTQGKSSGNSGSGGKTVAAPGAEEFLK